MEKENYWHFAHVENELVDAMYVFNPQPIDNVYDEESAKKYLESISGKLPDSFVDCFNGDKVKGVYPKVGYHYIKEEDVFSE